MKFLSYKRKRLLSFVLAFALLISIFSIMPLSASAAVGDVFTVDSFTYTVTADKEVKISGFDRVSTEAIIEESVNYEGVDYAITAIDSTNDVFRSCTSLEKITFKNPNLNITRLTFYKTSALKEIYIYSDMSFENLAIGGTPNLENVYCYSPNIVFGDTSFPTIASTPNLKFYGYDGSSAQKIANDRGYAFESLGSVPSTEPSTEVTEPSTEVTEPSTVATEPTTEPEDTSIFTWQTIDDGTAVEITGFKEQYKYTYDVVIPSEINGLPVTSIGYNAFYGRSIFNLEFPASVKVISERAFRECGYLKTVTFPEDSQLEVIGNDAFYRMQGQSDTLNEVILPASLKQIGYRAFYNRENLLTVKVLSKDVVFGDPEKGTAVFDLFVATSRLKLYGYTDSTTQAYAAEHGHMFRYLDLNTDELQALYDQASAIDSSLYTEESYANLETAMKAAKRMLANRDATPEMVDECVKNLQAAIDGLVEYVEPTSAEPTTIPIVYAEYIVGDVDGDLKVKINDVTTIQKHSAEIISLEGTNLLAADIDANGLIDIRDVTILQKWLADYDEVMKYKIGETVTIEVTPTQPTNPQPTDPQPTDPQPTDPQPTDPEDDYFYVPNYVSWLTDLGGKLWIYNDATGEFELMDYGEDFRCFYIRLPKDWKELSIYRTPFETTAEDFDINSPWDDETKTGVILNKWEHLGDRGDNNCYKITGDGEGFYTMFDPDNIGDDERTIYFDNSKTQWGTVYIYGWSFGLYQEFVPMEPEGNDIWSYTFYDDLPVDGVKGFLFVDNTTWSGTQTDDLATQEGKNLFVPIPAPAGQKLKGTWDVYNP